MATATSARQIFDNICTRFRADKAASDKATFLFNLSGEDGGQFWAHITDGTCSAGEGTAPAPADITIITSSEDFVKLVNGELNAMTAFMQGKFKVQGNMSVALKMIGWFDLG